MDALHERAAPDADQRFVGGKARGGILGTQGYSSESAMMRRSTRSWATRIRAIAAGKSPAA